MRKLYPLLVILLTGLLLVSCETAPAEWKAQGDPTVNDIDKSMNEAIAQNEKISQGMQDDVANDVSDALLPDLEVQSPNEQPLPRFDVSVDDISAKSFFMSLVQDSPYNVVVDPSIVGTISIHLKQVTVPEVLEALKEAYGYQYEVKNFGIYVTKGKIETRTFKVHYIDLERSGKSNTDISSGQLSQSTSTNADTATTTTTNQTPAASSVSTVSKSSFWETLRTTINVMVGDTPGSQVVINSEAGLIIIKAFPETLDEVAKYLDDVQSIMTQQVIIEAKILEIALTKEYQAGVDWNILGLSQDSSQAFTSTDELGTFSSMFTLDISSGSAFSTVINLLGAQGNVQVLSSPRIATLNNQKAVIKVGDDQYYITNISSTVSTGSTTSDNTQDVELTPFFSGIALDVTPEISGKKEIILHIHPIVSDVTSNTINYTINGEAQEIPSAASEIKETDNIVSAENGQIVVIGGLMSNQTREYVASTPYADKIPMLGNLFKRTHQESVNSELVILLKPVVIDSHILKPQLESISEQFKKLKRGFHYGPYPERFGNLAEYPDKTGE